jgi:mono/diheme cytochrome c family protein
MNRIIVVLGFVGLMLIGDCAQAQDSEPLYTQKCASCHAKDGSGHTGVAGKLEVPDFRSKRIKEMSDSDMYDSIAQGTRHREYPHAFLHTGLTEQQIQGLVKYIRVLASSKPSSATPGKAQP